MLFHLSIEADRPQRAAQLLAEIWGGEAIACSNSSEGRWIALAPNRGGVIHVGPRTPGGEGSAAHFSMCTELTIERIYEIGFQEGWRTTYRRRGGKFGVIELWIEDRQCIEVLTPEMRAEYLEFVTPENARAMLGWKRAA